MRPRVPADQIPADVSINTLTDRHVEPMLGGSSGGVMKLLLTFAAVAVIVCSTLVALVALSAPPNTLDIDADIARVRAQLEAAETEKTTYGTSLIATLIEARIQVLNTNEAFLQMKRNALLRRVDLLYVVNGHQAGRNSERISSLESDIAATMAEVEKSRAEADRYTGGLVQSLALARAATYELTLAQLNLSLMAERHGLLVQSSESGATKETPVGQTVVNQDGDAL